MNPDILSSLTLICPRCRRRSERGRELWTVALAEVFVRVDAQVIEGVLVCANPTCRARYPIFDGIPILCADPAAVIAAQPTALIAQLHPQTLALLAEGDSDEAPLAQLLDHLSIYLDAHWGDRSQPGLDGALGGWGGAALFSAVAERAQHPVDCAVELGCSVGRGVAALAAGAQKVVGVDLHLGALRAARQLLTGAPLGYARRIIGRHYQPVQIAGTPPLGGHRAARDVLLVCGDALDPPLLPQAFSRVVALNLLDSVRSPPQLLNVLDGLCRAGGEVLMTSPYSWHSNIVQEGQRIGGANPAAALRQLFAQGEGLEAPYQIEEERELPWNLRRDARSVSSYLVHMLRARKKDYAQQSLQL